jgi:dihydroxy-acid dehydratase
MGYSDDALNRPIVGITNTYSDYNPCHGNVPQIIEAVKRGVMLTGAMPMVFPTISIARELLASDLDVSAQSDGDGHRGDDPRPADGRGGVIGGCDKTLPAQIMAAVSADLPTVVIPVGPMVVGITRARCSAPAPIAGGCGANTAPAKSTMSRSKPSTAGSRRRSAPAW